MIDQGFVRPEDIEPLDYVVLKDLAPLNLTGLIAVLLEFMTNKGEIIVFSSATPGANPAGVLTITDAATGKIRLTPNTPFWRKELLTYDARAVVVDSRGRHVMPKADALRYNIYKGW